MPRVLYSCICDGCKQKITDQNQENDVSLNLGKYVYCDECYRELTSIWESWTNSRKPVRI